MWLIVFQLDQCCRNFHAQMDRGNYNLGEFLVEKKVEPQAFAVDLQVEEKSDQKTHMEPPAAAKGWCSRLGIRTGGD